MASEQHEDAAIISFEGERVALGPMRRELLPLYYRWANDFIVERGNGAVFVPITLAEQEAALNAQSSNRQMIRFTVYERSSMRPIGITMLNDISRWHGTAEFAIMLGERDAWGKGYGTETTRLLLDYAFTACGLHNVMLKVHAFNERAIHAYRRAGFKEIGRRRSVIPLVGARHDDVYMDCIATEFASSLLARLLAPEEPLDSAQRTQ